MQDVSAQNETWWNELCGSAAARAWGVTDRSPDSLRRYDINFFEFYPYLKNWLYWPGFAGHRTLEIGLGYCSVTQRLAESRSELTAMDIADGPVAMANHRFRAWNLNNARAIKGDILDPPADIGKFEFIVAIGCLHHTGNLAKAIDSCHDLLVPGGKLIGMVYNTFSHRQWWNNPIRTARHALRERKGYRGSFIEKIDTSAYDSRRDGSLAPSTEFCSVRSLMALCSKFESVKVGKENTNQEWPFRVWKRDTLLKTPLPRLLGLDLYWIATK